MSNASISELNLSMPASTARRTEANTITVYLCEDTVDGIFSAIYRAWEAGTSHTDVRVKDNFSCRLFEEYIEAPADISLAQKVRRSIINKLSDEVYSYVYQAALSCDSDKASVIYHFLQKAFRIGPRILDYLQDSDVMRVFELSRLVGREAHKYLGFVRFEELENGILAGRINPHSNIVPIIAEHFADRLHNENWLLLDTPRNLAAVHASGKGYMLHLGITEAALKSLSLSPEENDFRQLWNRFFDTIAIKERVNPELQRTMMPLRYRTYM